MLLSVLAMLELVQVAEGVRKPLDYPWSPWDDFKLICFLTLVYTNIPKDNVLKNNTGIAVIDLIELMGVAEGIGEHLDHPGSP